MRGVSRAVSRIARWFTEVYQLDIELDLARCLIDDTQADQFLPNGGPRTAVVVLEEDDDLWLGLYVDPRDRHNMGVLVEETSHLLCVAQHARWNLPVSLLALELQAEVDRFVFRRLRGGDPFAHFRSFLTRPGLDPLVRSRYRAAHDCGYRYCRGLMCRFPNRSDVSGLLRELRHFYRASPQVKLRMATSPG